MFDHFNDIDEQVADLGFKVGKMIVKDRTPEEAEYLANIFIESVMQAMEKFANFDER